MSFLQIALLLILALLAYVRFAPSSVDRFHVAPQVSKDEDLIHVWSKLQTSDHFYYMSTKAFEDGATRDYLSPYKSPYDGYIYFMNALSDLELSCKQRALV